MLNIIFLFSLFYVQNNASTVEREWEPDCVGDEYNGTCVEPHRCFSTSPFISRLKYPLPCTLTDGKPGVCCTDCKLVTNSSDAHLDHGGAGLLWKTGEKAWDKCLEYSQKYVYTECAAHSWMMRHKTESDCHIYSSHAVAAVGGVDVKRGEFPHMALLGYRDTQTSSQWLCSGSLISERFLLTAGHCLYSQDLGPVSEAAFGILKRTDPPELWKRYKIKRAIPHPQYKPPRKYHDIALLETELPVLFDHLVVNPACLPARGDKVDYDGFPVGTATGWGYLGYHKDLADTMQKVKLNRYTQDECSELYPAHRHQVHGINATTQMCFGHKTVIRDTCQGDSGGPIQIDTHYPTCIHTLLGVTSYGRECGYEGGAGVYTRIAPYLPWIESVVWP